MPSQEARMDELNEICNYLPIGADLGTAGQPGPQ